MPKLIVIIVIAAAVLGVILYAGQQGGGTLPSAAPKAQQRAQSQPRSVELPLLEQNKSGISGMVKMTEVEGKLMVMVDVKGAPTGVSQPAHIHLGRCPGVGEVKYPLTNLTNGKSETTLNTTIDMLKEQLPLSLNVNDVACGTLFEE